MLRVSNHALNSTMLALKEFLPRESTTSRIVRLEGKNGMLLVEADRDHAVIAVSFPAEGELDEAEVEFLELAQLVRGTRKKPIELTNNNTEGQNWIYFSSGKVTGNLKSSTGEVSSPKKPRSAFVEQVYEGKSLTEVLSFLYDAHATEDRHGIFGLLFVDDKLIMTDGSRAHIQSGFPPFPRHFLLPMYPAAALKTFTEQVPVTSVTIRHYENMYIKERGSTAPHGVLVLVKGDNGETMKITSPAPNAHENIEAAMPMVTQEAIGVVLSIDEMLSVLQEVQKRGIDDIRFRFGNGLSYGAEHEKDESNVISGVLSAMRSLGVMEGERSYAPRYLMEAARGMRVVVGMDSNKNSVLGGQVQLILLDPIPARELKPLIVNGHVPDRFAVVMPKTEED